VQATSLGGLSPVKVTIRHHSENLASLHLLFNYAARIDAAPIRPGSQGSGHIRNGTSLGDRQGWGHVRRSRTGGSRPRRPRL
jgi:hypothetical protein